MTSNGSYTLSGMIFFSVVFFCLTEQWTEAVDAINAAIQEIERKTCIYFKSKTSRDRDYVEFYNGQGYANSNISQSLLCDINAAIYET